MKFLGAIKYPVEKHLRGPFKLGCLDYYYEIYRGDILETLEPRRLDIGGIPWNRVMGRMPNQGEWFFNEQTRFVYLGSTRLCGDIEVYV